MKIEDSEQRFRKLIAQAEINNQRLDNIDKELSENTPLEAGMVISTVLIALEAGIKMNDWSYVAEAYIMLKEKNNG